VSHLSLSNPDVSMMSRYTNENELDPLMNNPAFKKYDAAFKKLDTASKMKFLSAVSQT